MPSAETLGRYIFPARPVRAAVLDERGRVRNVGEVVYATTDGRWAVRCDGERNSHELPGNLVSFDEHDVDSPRRN